MSDRIYFEGTCLYANIPPRPAKSWDDGKSTYSIQVECTQKRFDDLIKQGMSRLTTLREVDGKTYLNIRATKSLPATVDREAITFQDITVVDSSNNTVTESLANGSTVNVAVDVVKNTKGIVLRLKGVQVLNLIPYTGDSLFGNSEQTSKTVTETSTTTMINGFLYLDTFHQK